MTHDHAQTADLLALWKAGKSNGLLGPQSSCPDLMTLAGYLDDRLPASARDSVEAHLATCEPCLEQVRFGRRLAAEDSRKSSATLGHAVSPVVDDQNRLRRARRRKRILAFGAIAAAASLAWGGFLLGQTAALESLLPHDGGEGYGGPFSFDSWFDPAIWSEDTL